MLKEFLKIDDESDDMREELWSRVSINNYKYYIFKYKFIFS